MTPVSTPTSRDTDPINGGWLVFGNLLAESLAPAMRPVRLHPKEARTLWRLGRLRGLLNWWFRPLPGSRGNSATDAATRLEILTRGGFPR